VTNLVSERTVDVVDVVFGGSGAVAALAAAEAGASVVLDAGIDLLLDSRVVGMTREGSSRFSGVTVVTDEGITQLAARRGVVLACGGFSGDPRECIVSGIAAGRAAATGAAHG
jgi:hypothetical protein